MKTLGRGPKRTKRPSICLLQHFCPLCFKGKIGVSSGIRVPVGSPLIDEVQAMHAAKGNGLCPLDFRNPGEFCSNSLLCKMNCLVCGEAMMDGTEPDFELFLDFMNDPTTEITTMFSIDDVMKTRRLAWTEQWNTPIHRACSKKTVCKCVVAIGTTVCPTHFTRLDSGPPRPKSAPAPARVPTTDPDPPRNDGEDDEPPALATARIYTYKLTKADWLPTPSAMPIPPPECPPERKKIHITAPIVRPDGQAKPAKTIAKPKTSKTVVLAKAAEKCAFKLDKWAGHNGHPSNKGLPGPRVNSEGSGFSLEEHARRFDPELHGPRVRNGVKGYVRYDGVFIPTTHDVNCMHADGSLTPG